MVTVRILNKVVVEMEVLKMLHFINIILIAVNVAFYVYGLSIGANYWWSLFAVGFVVAVEVAKIIQR